ncbi:hypothetical protein BH11MYX2_BH11MYX2_38730 [soil metagenome]
MISSRRSMLLCLALVVITSCSKHDNSAETDKTGAELRKAQDDVAEHSKELAKNQSDIEQQQRDLVREQEQLADKQKMLVQQREQLGSAQGTLVQARAAYEAAVNERRAKLDAAIATRATKTDAKSKDAVAGFGARRDQLAKKLDTMPAVLDADWHQYTKDVDVTFDAIEGDLSHL